MFKICLKEDYLIATNDEIIENQIREAQDTNDKEQVYHIIIDVLKSFKLIRAAKACEEILFSK